ncbi:GTPase-activating protein [Cryptotrichosporon argae]
MSAADEKAHPIDELHPAASGHEAVDAHGAVRNGLRTDEIIDTETAAQLSAGQTIPTGVPYPLGAANVTPAIPVSAAAIDGAGATMSEKPAPSSASSTTLALSKKKRQKKSLFSKKGKGEPAPAAGKDAELVVPSVGFFQLFRFATPLEIALNLVGVVLACAAGAAQPLMTLIFGKLTTSFTNYAVIANAVAAGTATAADLDAARSSLRHTAGDDALYLLAIGVGMFLCTYVYMLVWNWTSEAISKRVRERYLRAVLRQEIAYFDDLGAGEVATRIQTDCDLQQSAISEKVPIACSYLATFVTGFALAYARSWRLALALSAILPVIAITGGTMVRMMTKYTTASLGNVAKAGTLAEEAISSIRTIHAFGTAKIIGQNFDAYIDKSRQAGIKGSWIEGGGLGIIFFSIYSAYALAFFYGGILVTQGHANSGIVINVFMSVLIGSFSMAMLTPEIQAISKGRAAAAKLFETIDRVPSIDSADPGGLRPDTVRGEISFENVKFHYPSRPNVPILKGFSATFKAGETVALVGASGSGKSTVISLIERFYAPVAGTIRLDGNDISTLNVKWLRQQIGLVSQEPTLFATTVRGNIEHGLIGSKWEHASDAERFALVKKACIDANADGFISKLPQGYDTKVGERGMLMSGGQKQRLCIARGIVADPRILLLDEATSALDTQSEGIVQDALDKASKGRTTIAIAHRLSTVRDYDRIIVMGAGEIIEQGNHNSLLENADGAYAQLVNAQKLNQAAAAEAARAAGDDGTDLPDPDAVPTEKAGFADLARAPTGRSVASQLLEQMRAQREADATDYDKMGIVTIFRRLIALNREQRKWYISGTIAAICTGLVYPALSIIFGRAIQAFEIVDPTALKKALARYALWYFITAILAGLCIYVQNVSFSRTGWTLTAKLRSKAFDSVLRHDVEWFDEEANTTGAVTSNLADQPQKVQGLFGVTMGTIIQSCATLVGGCIIGLIFDPLLALIGIACIPLLVSGGYIRLRVVVLKDGRNKKIHAASAHLASEAAAAVRTVASLTREDDVDAIYSKALEEPMRISNRTAIYSQALYAASQGVSFLIIALVFYVGALWMTNGSVNTSHFYTTLTSVIFASIQAGNVWSFVPDASKGTSGARSLFELFDNEPTIDALSDEGIKLDPAQVQGHIRLEDVHFRYPSRPGVRVLRGLTIDAPPGSFIALVGPSGCGKSSTISLVSRFYDALTGAVQLDGVDIKDINVASFRAQMALVSQEPTLYAGSVEFNIRLGAFKPIDQVTQDEVVQAAKDANIHDFVMSLPDGYNTDVGSKGTQLSGGQKQRLALARALIRRPKILLLDEATSALDSQSEKVVQAALDAAAKGRTTIAVAHRLSTIQKADIIYVLGEGKVAEQGTHQELLAKRGAYYELVQMQNLSRQ